MVNPVFDRLVGEDVDDIEGLTAYALYKKHKRAWSAGFQTDNGCGPTPEEDAAFAKAVSTVDQLDRYRKDARDILVAFANVTVEDARPGIEQEAITARIERAASEAGRQTAFWMQVQIGIVSSAIFTIILIFLAIGLQTGGIDFLTMMESIKPQNAEVLSDQ
jgi:hypothetical protein